MKNLEEKILKSWLETEIDDFNYEIKNADDIDEICDFIDGLKKTKDDLVNQVEIFCLYHLTTEMEEYATDEEISLAFGNWHYGTENLTLEELKSICRERANVETEDEE